MSNRPRTEEDLHGVPVRVLPGGVVTAGPVYAPIYWVGASGDNRDKVMIDDEAFTSTKNDMEAAKTALMRRVDTELAGLIWTRKIGVVTLQGIHCRKGRVGPFDVLFIAGPTFDGARRADDREAQRRAAAGLPTGLPGSRKIIVATKADL